MKAKTVAVLLLGVACVVSADPGSREDVPWTLETLVERVPPLEHDVTDRWPMITREHFTQKAGDNPHSRGEPLAAEMYRALVSRGPGETIQLHPKYIPMALAMQEAGAGDRHGGRRCVDSRRFVLDPGNAPGSTATVWGRFISRPLLADIGRQPTHARQRLEAPVRCHPLPNSQA